MRVAELHTLPTYVVEQILKTNQQAIEGQKRFTRAWLMTDNVITICKGILNSRKG